MKTPAQLLDHFDRTAPTGLAQSMGFAASYKQLSVLGAGTGPVTVSVHKYRMNTDDPSKLDEAGRIRDKVADAEARAAINSVHAWVRSLNGSADAATHRSALVRLGALRMIRSSGESPRRLRRVFSGKGGPRDIALALGLLDSSGRLGTLYPGFDSQTAMQNYCDRFIGVDCSGFVNNYFTAIGRKPDNLADWPSIAHYARAGRRLAAAPGSPRNHVFCWVRGESRTGVRPRQLIGFSHIIVADEWDLPPNPYTHDPAGARFRCSQSASSLGGITRQVYQIVRGPSAGARANTWRIRRVAGMGDNVLEPRSIVWNDVFLAAPL